MQGREAIPGNGGRLSAFVRVVVTLRAMAGMKEQAWTSELPQKIER
jgi:hypothetical protein